MPTTGREKAEFNELYQTNPELSPGFGSGLVLDGNGDIAIDSDGVTVEISGGKLQVKAVGIDTAQLALLSVDATRLSGSAVTTAKIDDDAVDKDKIAAHIAGAGLSQAAGGELDIGAGLVTDAMLTNNKWTFKAGDPVNSAATAEPNTIYAGTDGGTSYIYVCVSAGWGPNVVTPENWMRVALAAF